MRSLLSLCLLTTVACATPQKSARIERGFWGYSQGEEWVARGDVADLMYEQPHTVAQLEAHHFELFEGFRIGFGVAGLATTGAYIALLNIDGVDPGLKYAAIGTGIGLEVGALVFLLLANHALDEAVHVHNRALLEGRGAVSDASGLAIGAQ